MIKLFLPQPTFFLFQRFEFKTNIKNLTISNRRFVTTKKDGGFKYISTPSYNRT